MSNPYAQLLIAVGVSLGYWCLYRRARWSDAILRVPPADWLRIVEWALAIPLWLQTVLPPLLVPFVPGLVLHEVLVSSVTLLAVIAGLRTVFRSAELTVTRQGLRVFVFRVRWSEVERVVVDDRSVRFCLRGRAPGALGVPIPFSDLGWRITPEIGRRVQLYHWWLGPIGDRRGTSGSLVA